MYPPSEGALRWRGGAPAERGKRGTTEGLRACWPRSSDRSRVKKRIHPATAHFTEGDGRHRPGPTGLPFFAADRPGGARFGLGLELDPPGPAGGYSRLGKELAQLGEGPALGVEVAPQGPDFPSDALE